MSFLLALLLALLTVRGEVRDAVAGAPVSGVMIASAAAQGGAVTDAAGGFTLELSGPARVRFGRVGYQTVEHVIASDTTLIVQLEPAAPSLEP